MTEIRRPLGSRPDQTIIVRHVGNAAVRETNTGAAAVRHASRSMPGLVRRPRNDRSDREPSDPNSQGVWLICCAFESSEKVCAMTVVEVVRLTSSVCRKGLCPPVDGCPRIRGLTFL